MPEISPKITDRKLKSSARKISEGKGPTPYPGVRTGAKHVNAADTCGREANRGLALSGRSADARREEERRGQDAFRATIAALPQREPSSLDGQGPGCG